MIKVFLWFTAYWLAFGIFAGMLSSVSVTLDILIVTTALTCAATFAYTFSLHDRIIRCPGLMLLLFPLLYLVVLIGSEVWLFHALVNRIDQRVEKIRVSCGEINNHYDRADFSQSLLDVAASGDISARRRVAWCYMNGLGVEKDSAAAARWYRLSAEQGDKQSQLRLGWLYDRGIGLNADIYEAERWLKLAAEQGEVWAQAYLGVCYARGFCGNEATKDAAAASLWLGKSVGMVFPEAKGVFAHVERLRQRKWLMLTLLFAIVLCVGAGFVTHKR